jgi:hypothetical protein
VSDVGTNDRAPDALGTVSILGCPLGIFQQGRRHAEALLRELAIIVDGGGDNTELPKRFLDTIAVVRRRAGGLNTGAEKAIEEAIERGDEEIDFDVVLPAAIGRGASQFSALLDEIDQYCRAGDLLTLEAPSEVRAFQRWYLTEIERQLGGEPPTRWSVWRDSGAGRAAIRS